MATLKDDMKADLDIFFNPEEFAVKAIYDGTAEIDVLFALESDEATESLLPVIRCKGADVPGIARGTRFEVDGKVYGTISWYLECDAMVIVLNEVV